MAMSGAQSLREKAGHGARGTGHGSGRQVSSASLSLGFCEPSSSVGPACPQPLLCPVPRALPGRWCA